MKKTTYQYVSGKLMYEDRNGTDVYYFYDSNGTPTAIRYYEADGTSHRFFLATNQQGDVIGLYNASGDMVVKYEYDAWGNIISETNATGGTPTSLAQYWSEINPFRYRGYYYDSETGLYYLQSRYYDAEVGRFISSDSLVDTGDALGFNVFAYCGNNPVNREDSTGHLWDVALDIVSIVYSAYQVIKEPDDVWNWVGLVVDVACAAVPVACGGGVAVRALSKGDDVVDAVKVATKADDAYDTVKAADKIDNACDSTRTVTNFTSRGSTGRIEPANLSEQLAMEQVMSNPYVGTPLTKITMNDPRWSASEGWVKMQQIIPTSQGDVNIHYVYNQTLGLFDDFKFNP